MDHCLLNKQDRGPPAAVICCCYWPIYWNCLIPSNSIELPCVKGKFATANKAAGDNLLLNMCSPKPRAPAEIVREVEGDRHMEASRENDENTPGWERIRSWQVRWGSVYQPYGEGAESLTGWLRDPQTSQPRPRHLGSTWQKQPRCRL